MASQHNTPRCGLRKRPANEPQPQRATKRTDSSMSRPDISSTVVRPNTGCLRPADPAASDLGDVDTFTHDQKDPTRTPSDQRNSTPHQLTIMGQTFFAPLPPNKTTDPEQNAINIPGNHQEYRLFVCEDCPIQQNKGEYDLHDLCYDTHPCIWSFPPKAREAYANRHHWLDIDKPLEETRLPSGWLPRLLDEGGEPITRGLIGVQKGVDLNRAYDEMVKRRYAAVIKAEESCEHRDAADDDYSYEDYCEEHWRAREAMLENMSWRFDW